MLSEQWKSVPGFPRYEVSSLGRVRSQVDSARYGHGWLIKSPVRSNKGLIIGLTGEKTTTISLQRLVAIVWCGPPPTAKHKWVAFKDGNHENYSAENLEWTDVSPSRGKQRSANSWKINNPPRVRSSPTDTALGVPPADAATEEWRAIPSVEGYDVSSFGRVRSWRGLEPRILALQETPTGYLNVVVGGKPSLVHRLVADAFCVGRSDERNQVNHKDGDVSNNFFDNLEWLSAKENSQHAHDTGLWTQGAAHGQRLLRPPTSMYASIRMAVAAGAKTDDLARQNGWNERVVLCLARGGAWANESESAFTDEQWKGIPGTKHEVSSYGRVRRAFNGKLLKVALGGNGYPAVTIPIDSDWRTVKVHRLVAAAFVPRVSDQHIIVNHKDGDKENNHNSNLEWTTPSHNVAHAHNTGLISKKKTRFEPRVNVPDAAFPREDGEEWRSLSAQGYFVSSLGRIVSTWQSTRLLIPRGRFVKVAGKHIAVADLVAEAFLPAAPTPCHIPVPIDGDMNNCAAANLAWGLEVPKPKGTKTRRDTISPLGGSGKGSNKGRINDHQDSALLLQQVADGALRPSAAARMMNVTCSAVTRAARRYSK